MGDNCNNCPENNPECSRTSLRIDNVEKWQNQHDERYKTSSDQRKKDTGAIKTGLTIAIVMMVLNLLYNSLILPRIEKNELRQKTRYQGYELHDSRNGGAHADSSRFRVRD